MSHSTSRLPLETADAEQGESAINTDTDTDTVYTEYEESLIADLVEEGIDPDDLPVARLFLSTLWTFHYARGFNDEALGDVDLVIDGGKLALRLSVWVADNDNGHDATVKPLEVLMHVDRYQLPEKQIRQLIHTFLCHEADEQMWFGNTRPYHPHGEQA